MSDWPATGVIHDIGYQRYTGPRLGRGYAVRSLYAHGLRTAFGLGRSAKAKIFPWSVVGIVMLRRRHPHRGPGPDRAQMLIGYSEFPAHHQLLIVLFCAVVGARAGLPRPARAACCRCTSPGR